MKIGNIKTLTVFELLVTQGSERRLSVALAFAFAGVLASTLNAQTPAEFSKTIAALRERPVVLLTKASDQDYQRVSMVSMDAGTNSPKQSEATSLGCTRLHVSANGTVLCFTKVLPGKPKYYSNPTSYVFDRDFKLVTSFRPARGIISRARISSDAKYVATTAFTTGHSYLGVGGTSFSTATLIAKANDARSEENIQQWTLLNQGVRVDATDLNLWGVTFDPRNSDRFFVTAYFNGKPHLAEGNVATKSISVVKEGMECPSFSPDGTKLAFKKRTSATTWSPAVYDISTKRETVFSVPNSVDDQIEWLDEATLIYEVLDIPLVGKPKINLMTLNLRVAPPQQSLWMADARSPTVIR